MGAILLYHASVVWVSSATKIRISCVHTYEANYRKNFLILWCCTIPLCRRIYWVACHWDLYPSVVLKHDNTSLEILSEFFLHCDTRYFFYFKLPRCIVKREDAWMLSLNARNCFFNVSISSCNLLELSCITDFNKFMQTCRVKKLGQRTVHATLELLWLFSETKFF